MEAASCGPRAASFYCDTFSTFLISTRCSYAPFIAAHRKSGSGLVARSSKPPFELLALSSLTKKYIFYVKGLERIPRKE